MGEPHADDLTTTGEAAWVLGVSANIVHWLEREGRLPAQRTTNGDRLFRRGDVEKLAAERARAAGATSNEGARVPRDRIRRGKS